MLGKIIGIIAVCLIVLALVAVSPKDYEFEDAVVTNYKHKSFFQDSVTTVKFPDGDVRICKCLPYRDVGDIVQARKTHIKSWKIK
jgi:hypothetical protein